MPAAARKRIYAVVSSDRYLRRQALDGLLKRLGSGGGDGETPDVVQFRGGEAQLAEVLDEARTPSLLGGIRIVVVDDADEFITAHRPALERYCGDPSDMGILILAAQTFPSTTRLHKIITQSGEVVLAKPPDRQGLNAWISQRARSEYGKNMASAVVQRLKEQVGDSPGKLDAELSKLADYVGERSAITVEDVNALCGHSREEQVFAVMDAVLDGHAAEALKQWDQVLATNRAAPALAVAGLASTVRRTLQARMEYESGVNAYALSRKLFADPATVERRLRSIDKGTLLQMQRDLLAADLAIKTGAAGVEAALERFIVTYSTRGRSLRAGTG